MSWRNKQKAPAWFQELTVVRKLLLLLYVGFVAWLLVGTAHFGLFKASGGRPYIGVGIAAGVALLSFIGVARAAVTSKRVLPVVALLVALGGAVAASPAGATDAGSTRGIVTNYTGPGIDGPRGIAAGPDGASWFTNSANNSIGRLKIAKTVTKDTATKYKGTGIDHPYDITTGPDGALWFTNFYGGSIGRITTAGVVTNYTGTGIDSPWDITTGPDGAMWFTNHGNNSIRRITTAGVVSNYTGTGIDGPAGITTGPDGAMWFTNYDNGSIGRVTVP
jgi:streptogramin lyase